MDNISAVEGVKETLISVNVTVCSIDLLKIL